MVAKPAQLPEGILLFNGVDYTAIPEFVQNLNNTLSNLGNLTTNVNYGAWGPYVSSAPLAGFKASLYEGGLRAPFIIKEPSSTATPTTTSTTSNASNTSSSPIKSFMFLTDLTPTFLDYANVPQPPAGSTYNGTEGNIQLWENLSGLFLIAQLEEIHRVDEPIGVEMFNNTVVYKDPWVAINDKSHPTGKGWELAEYRK